MIHLECDNDEALAMALGVPRSRINHRAGKGRISKCLSDSRSGEDMGMIDQDPGQPPPPYLRRFKVIENRSELGLILSRHPDEGKHLIEIQPDLEPWLYLIGTAVGVRPADHGLPEKMLRPAPGGQKASPAPHLLPPGMLESRKPPSQNVAELASPRLIMGLPSQETPA
jgi:hypothetical protein